MLDSLSNRRVVLLVIVHKEECNAIMNTNRYPYYAWCYNLDDDYKDIS